MEIHDDLDKTSNLPHAVQPTERKLRLSTIIDNMKYWVM